MLQQVEEKARGQGFRRVALTVDVENEGAFALYRRTGYVLIETVKVKVLRQRIGYRGFHRMVKVLT
jgi:ribosomal protein S18 acetylase RimI-like enzyme